MLLIVLIPSSGALPRRFLPQSEYVFTSGIPDIPI